MGCKSILTAGAAIAGVRCSEPPIVSASAADRRRPSGRRSPRRRHQGAGRAVAVPARRAWCTGQPGYYPPPVVYGPTVGSFCLA